MIAHVEVIVIGNALDSNAFRPGMVHQTWSGTAPPAIGTLPTVSMRLTRLFRTTAIMPRIVAIVFRNS